MDIREPEEDPINVGVSFIQGFYHQLNKEPEGITRYFGSNSYFTFTDKDFEKPCRGQDEIRCKISSLNFMDVRTDVKSVDCQASINGSVIVVVHGLHFQNKRVRRFSQTFLLARTHQKAQKSFFVANSCFRYLSEENEEDVYEGDEKEEDEEEGELEEELEEDLNREEVQNENNVDTEPITLKEEPQVQEPEIVENLWKSPADEEEIESTNEKQEEIQQPVEIPESSAWSKAEDAAVESWGATHNEEEVVEEKATPPDTQIEELNKPQYNQQPKYSPKAYSPPTNYAEAVRVPAKQPAPFQRTHAPAPGGIPPPIAKPQPSKSQRNARQGGFIQRPETFAIFLAQLPPNTKEEEIQSLFRQFGNITAVRIIPQKRIAFIDFDSLEAVVRVESQAETITVNGVTPIIQRVRNENKARGTARGERKPTNHVNGEKQTDAPNQSTKPTSSGEETRSRGQASGKSRGGGRFGGRSNDWVHG